MEPICHVVFFFHQSLKFFEKYQIYPLYHSIFLKILTKLSVINLHQYRQKSIENILKYVLLPSLHKADHISIDPHHEGNIKRHKSILLNKITLINLSSWVEMNLM